LHDRAGIDIRVADNRGEDEQTVNYRPPESSSVCEALVDMQRMTIAGEGRELRTTCELTVDLGISTMPPA